MSGFFSGAGGGGGGGGDVTKVGTPVDNQVGVWTGDGTIEGSSNLTFDGNSLFTQTGSASAVPFTVKGAASQSANYLEIKRSDNATLFSFDEDAVGGKLGIHANSGALIGFYRINSGGAVNGLDLGAYDWLNFINQASASTAVKLRAIGNTGSSVDVEFYTYYSNVIFSGYTGGGANGGEVIFRDLNSGLETMHVYQSNNSNMGVRFPNGNIIIGGTGVPDAKLDVNGTIKLSEQASATADTAGKGQLWVKNTTPCQLWFTDDAGTATQIV